MNQLFIALSVLVLSATSWATCETDTAQVTKDFEFRSYDGKRLEVDLCEALDQSVLASLTFLKTLPAHHLPKSDLNQNLLTAEPYEYFRDRVKVIVLIRDEANTTCESGPLAYVSPVHRDEKEIRICPRFRLHDVVETSGVLVHESRHAESTDYAHVACAAGMHQGAFSCDESYEVGGSYAVGLEYLIKLVKNPGLARPVREVARRAALMEFATRFNKLPLDLKAGALLRHRDERTFTFYDGSTESPTFIMAPANTVMSLQGGLPLAFTRAQRQPTLFTFARDWGPPVNDVLTDHFTNIFSSLDRDALVAVGYGRTEACIQATGRIDCYGPDRQVIRVSTSNWPPGSLLYSGATRLLEPHVFFYRQDDGHLRRLPPDAGDLRSTPPASWPVSQSVFPFRAGGNFAGGELWLTTAGTLQILAPRTKALKRAAGIKSSPVEDLLTPFIWSTRLFELEIKDEDANRAQSLFYES